MRGEFMSSSSLMAELEVAVKTGTPEKRVETLRRVTSQFLSDSDRLNDQQISVFDDVLVHLIERIEAKALVQLSSALAPVDNAPIGVIRRLSRHDEITIAGPILSKSSRLSEHDLIEIASSRGQGHLLAMSGRASLPETVTDVLINRGNAQVHHSLARNSGARFSETGFAALVKKSESDEKLAERLGLRLDIPLQLLRQLLARATDLVRSRLLAAATPENQEQIQRALASIANEVGRAHKGVRAHRGARRSAFHDLCQSPDSGKNAWRNHRASQAEARVAELCIVGNRFADASWRRLLGQAAGVEMVHIPYRSAAQSLSALLANDVQIYIGTIPGALDLEQSGKLKIISSAGPVRNPALPNIPTVADAGLPDFKIGNWWALVAPRGTHQTVIDVLSREMKAALAKPDVQERLMKIGMVPIGGSPKELAEQIGRESEVWRNVIKSANITLN